MRALDSDTKLKAKRTQASDPQVMHRKHIWSLTLCILTSLAFCLSLLAGFGCVDGGTSPSSNFAFTIAAERAKRFQNQAKADKNQPEPILLPLLLGSIARYMTTSAPHLQEPTGVCATNAVQPLVNPQSDVVCALTF